MMASFYSLCRVGVPPPVFADDVGTSPYRLVFCSVLVGEAFHRLPYIKFHFYKRIKTKTAEVVASAVFPKI